ncbi:TetR/AcrR family transcriptional regulator [Maridesulfovibrio sp.]|uniref:TetR/AcrR family transcriptional regulator n=1 Tax=unclassified Maridesulfovibrio TaxID=2794999 RepID=UPI003AFFEBC2
MSDQTTKHRILEAASRVFCEKGFKSTTVRDICAEADANVAAINYHFGDKRKLYYKVLQLWMDQSMKHYTMLDESVLALPPEQKLRLYVRNELLPLCTYDDPERLKKRQIRLLLEEYVSEDCDPDLFKCHEQIEEKVLFPLIKELIEPVNDPKILEQACMAASGVIVHHFLMIIHYPEGEINSEEQLEFMIDFYTTFILGSLKAIKEKYHAE